MIQKNKLKVGYFYEIESRSISRVAVWTGKAFRGNREKFGFEYLFDEDLYDEDDGTATALKELEPCPIPFDGGNENDKKLMELIYLMLSKYPEERDKKS